MEKIFDAFCCFENLETIENPLINAPFLLILQFFSNFLGCKTLKIANVS
jgi:hypothetical protein